MTATPWKRRKKVCLEEGEPKVTNPTIFWYERNAAEISREYDKARVDTLHTLFRRWFPSRGKVLEIGRTSSSGDTSRIRHKR